MSTNVYTVEGMTCERCVAAITEEVTQVAGVTGVAVDLEAGTVAVTGDGIDEAAVHAAVDEAGFAVVG